jgi:pimeloyl-ACP methyl ester carboxylesterase
LYLYDVEQRLVEGVAVREWGDPDQPGILLWPGLGADGGYFAGIAEAMPGRAVAVDPPGFGNSPRLAHCTYDRLVELAKAVTGACGCRAMVGHSLGAYLAVGVAVDPPAGFRAAVLIDGGYLGVDELAKLGQPGPSAGRAELIAWVEQTTPRFPNWETAIRELAAMLGSDVTPAIEAYVRERLVEVDGEVRDGGEPERVVDLLAAMRDRDVPALAAAIAVPTLLIACGSPPEHRALRENAWRMFAQACAQVDLHVAGVWRHNPILQDPQASSRLVADWLSAHL